MKTLNESALKLKESVFSTITQLANKEQAINLAQGFPDFDGPAWVLSTAKQVMDQKKNQYAPSYGLLPLRQVVSDLYKKFYDLNYDPGSEVLITNGATEAIYATVQALINPGDEVVAFEPLYDSYLSSVQMARGNLKPVTLHIPDFKFDMKELTAQISDKTKLLIFNNPHNPTGKVFSKEEIEEIARLADKYDFYILSDEVYEYLTFGVDHAPTAAWEVLKQRTITISSIGKTLSLTGWKIGWACGPAELIKTIHNVHQFICFCVSHPFQETLAQTLGQWPDHLSEFRSSYQEKRDLLVQGLEGFGARLVPPQGTYFCAVQTPGMKDWEFCEKLIKDHKVATIPFSPFYLKSNEGESIVRFCFAKKNETIREALKKLEGMQF